MVTLGSSLQLDFSRTMAKRSIVPVLLAATLLLGSRVSCVEHQDPDETQFLFVHGGVHGAWCWYKVVTILQESGFKATALDMTSNGRDKTIADDVKTIAQHAKPLTDFLCNVSCKVVLVGHSLGGVAISYAMEQYPEKISKAIFVAALMPLNNQSALSSCPPWMFPRLAKSNVFSYNFANGPSAPATSLVPNLTVAPSTFYNKSPPMDVTVALSMLDDEPFGPLMEVLSLTPSRYGRIPRFYVKSDEDHVLTAKGLQHFINQNPPQKAFFIKGSDHSIFFSQTQTFTKLLVNISTL